MPLALVGLVPRPARQPDADRHRPDVRHRLGDEPQAVVEDFANDHALSSCRARNGLPRRIAEVDRKLQDSRKADVITDDRKLSRTPAPIRRASRLDGTAHWISAPHGRTAMPMPSTIAELDLPELEAALDALGHPRFHARQIFQWIHRRGVTDFAAMTRLGRELRAELAPRLPRRHARGRPHGAIDRRHDEVPAAAARRQADRIGLHSRTRRRRPSASRRRSAAR